MAESSTAISETKTIFPERDKDYPNVRFEPGIHPDAKGITNLRNRFSNGDFNAHGWNREVLKRMSQYSPEVIAIDSQPPLSFLGGEIIAPDLLWIGLPGKPSEISPATKEVYVVRGDITSYDYLFSRMGAKNIGESIETQKNRRDSNDTKAEDLALAMLGTLSISLFAVEHSIFEAKTSRRNFLKLTASVIGATTLLRFFSPFTASLASKSKNSEEKDFFVNLYNIFGRSFFKDNIVDCRTALLLAKEEDAIDFLGKPKNTSGAVLLGNAHSNKVVELMGNRSERLKTVSVFTKVLINSVDEALRNHPSPYSKEELVATFLNYVSSVEVVSVKDPQINSDGTFGVPPMVYVGTFQSPQVEKAISKYR